MKTASFTVRADMQQSIRWKRAADAAGYTSAGAWLADAADAFLRHQARAGLPIPLAWRKGRFRVILMDGAEVEVRGMLSPPFGYYLGTSEGPGYVGCKRNTLTHLPSKTPLVSLRRNLDCREIARQLSALPGMNWSDSEPERDAGEASEEAAKAILLKAHRESRKADQERRGSE